MPRFSVVVPVYGTAAYLPACLDSLLAQDFADWEAIVVNDASPDGSLAIARSYAARDPRFVVVDKEKNGGLHLARRTGVEAVGGDWVTFLDSDDELAPDTLSRLDERLPDDPLAIVHFGVEVIACEGLSEDTASSFERWVDYPYGWLGHDELLAEVFNATGDYGKNWNVCHRLFGAPLARRAFARMSDLRLERAEDGYEMMVLADMASGEVTANDIRGYRYFMGRGVTASRALTVDSFSRTASAMGRCREAAAAYAREEGGELLERCAGVFGRKLAFSLANEWYERVADQDKVEAARAMAAALGNEAAAAQLMRFVRDNAYSMLQHDEALSDDMPLVSWYGLACELAPGLAQARGEWGDLARAARSHMGDLDRLKAYARQPVRIFVSTHKEVDLFDSDILQPVQVGCALRDSRFTWSLHDDAGDNISAQNPLYCELTTQYWAWKNVDAEYYGFCHYRRYFDFSDEAHEENEWGEVIDDYINSASQRRYKLDDGSIRAAVEGYDVITTEFKSLADFPGTDNTPYKQYKAAPRLHLADLDRVVAILKDMHPGYAEDADAFLSGSRTCFCNMFIMRKQLFRDYCAWLFPILARFVAETDMSRYSVEALRTPGHLSERLFNIYYNHHMRLGAGWRTRELQCVHFDHPERIEPLAEPRQALPVVPVVFAADDNYVPMLTTAVASMLKNASPDRLYDVVVLTSDISGDHQAQMRAYLEGLAPHVQLRFHNVAPVIERYDLSTSNEHISVETYYRFLVPSVLPFYEKVLYLDSDLIVEGDVAELFDTDLGDDLLAAVSDVDYLGNLNMNDGARLAYTNKVLKMDDPYHYFQAGVLLLNTRAMREAYTTEQWLGFASAPDFIYDDQDVLNAHCEGRVHYLDPSWNVMHDCGARVGNVFSFAPAKAFQAYLAARSHPKIRHYAGFEKPWNTVGCDWAEHYWRYARDTPFYERLQSMLMGAGRRRLERPLPPKALSPKSPLRKVLDPLMPLGSHRREVAKSIGRRLKGLD